MSVNKMVGERARQEVRYNAVGMITEDGTVVVTPENDLCLEALLPALFERYGEQMAWDADRGMAYIRANGLCHLYADGVSAFALYDPAVELPMATAGTVPPTGEEALARERYSRVPVRALRARTAYGIVREGVDDWTLRVRVPKVWLQALQVPFETFAGCEVKKLLAQLCIDEGHALKPVPPRAQKPAAGHRRDSRGRFVKRNA